MPHWAPAFVIILIEPILVIPVLAGIE